MRDCAIDIHVPRGAIISFMMIRKARKNDFPQILEIARKYDLNYQGMEADDYWVADEGKVILGICGLRRNPDCLELCSLGVLETHRGRSLGKKLVQSLLSDVRGDIHLATVIPQFFARLGFERTAARPPSLVKTEEWCAGCTPELCTVMIKKKRG
jgi:N-acetylglutamate synthase-like GNAT family acetyltransferase